MKRTLAALMMWVPLVAGAQDPAVVNARTVRVTFENERVRVFEATVAPGEKEQVHSHPAAVIHVITGGKVRNHPVGGKAVESELVAGTTQYRGPVTHWAENIGDTAIRLVIVELKDPPAQP